MSARTEMQQTSWETVRGGSITVAQAALTTNKSAVTVDALAVANRAIIDAEDGTVALEVRFRGTGTNDVADVLNVYAMAGDSDHYTLMGTITITMGTQSDSTYTFYDGLSIADELWIDDVVTLNDASNCIARLVFNTQGYRKFLFIATTLNNTSVIVDYRRIG
jgi:hypothetical protein